LQLVRHALSTLPQEPPLSVVDAVAKPLRGSARRQRKWLQNFRRKWGARLGKLRVATTMSQAELQEKAPCSVLPQMYLFWEGAEPVPSAFGFRNDFFPVLDEPNLGVGFWAPKLGHCF
jgi:hypothetical protein